MEKKTTDKNETAQKNNNTYDIKRREVIKGVALAGLAVAASPAASLAQTVTGNKETQQSGDPLIDPRTRFPNNQPYQKQEFPALQSKMTPKPDCGETSYIGSGRLKGRKALVTGGDSGIGRAVAIAYAREGADVVINYLPEEEADAQDVIAIIRKDGRKAVGIAGDLRTEEFCKSLVSRAEKELGGLDILVSNAGFGWFYPNILEHPSEVFDRTIKTNVYAAFWLSKAAIAVMEAGSSIVFTNSVTSFLPSEAFIDYSATKGFLSAFTIALGKQVAPRGIRVNGVAPGAVWTPLQIYFGAPENNVENLNRITPLGRMGQPVEMSPLYVTLAEATNSFTTSTTWSASGGRV